MRCLKLLNLSDSPNKKDDPPSRGPSRGRRSRRAVAKRRRRTIALVAAATVLIGIFALAIAATLHWTAQRDDPPPPENPVVRTGTRSVDAPSAAEPLQPTRRVYRHSIVPGGVYTPQELALAVAGDPVVAVHYADINPSGIRVGRLRQPLAAHLSYRIGAKIYWTKRKLQLKAGEQILTDGNTTVRARCGNIVSMVPRAPVFAGEPIERELELFSEPIVPVSLPPLELPSLPKLTPPLPPPRQRSAVEQVSEPGTLMLVGFAVTALLVRHLLRRRTNR